VIDIKPSIGYLDEPTEVWIKGSDFGDSVSVRFGEVAVEVVEFAENLVVVKVPPLSGGVETKVPVIVANSLEYRPADVFVADRKPMFTYRPRPPPPPSPPPVTSGTSKNNNNKNNNAVSTTTATTTPEAAETASSPAISSSSTSSSAAPASTSKSPEPAPTLWRQF